MIPGNKKTWMLNLAMPCVFWELESYEGFFLASVLFPAQTQMLFQFSFASHASSDFKRCCTNSSRFFDALLISHIVKVPDGLNLRLDLGPLATVETPKKVSWNSCVIHDLLLHPLVLAKLVVHSSTHEARSMTSWMKSTKHKPNVSDRTLWGPPRRIQLGRNDLRGVVLGMEVGWEKGRYVKIIPKASNREDRLQRVENRNPFEELLAYWSSHSWGWFPSLT